MTFYELYKALNELFPRELSCEWDNDGIMCADNLNAQVKRALVALDVTNEVVEYACKNGFDTIISHHPLVFKSQRAITPDNFVQAKLIRLLKGSVKVMSFHTRLDAGNDGVNDTLATTLGLNVVEKDPDDPIGRICELEHKMPIDEFARRVKADLNAPVVSYAGKRAVKRIYLCGGDGKDMIQNAIKCHADTLLTGNASYNSILDAEESGINVIEAGHFYTENPVCSSICAIIKGLDNTIETEIFNSNKIEIV